MKPLLRIVGISLLCLSSAHAVDLGVRGHTYPVLEQDLAELIQQRLSALTPEEQEKLVSDLRDRYVASAKEPKPVKGIGESAEYRRFEHDPTLTLKADIKDHTGQVLFPKGTQINPLDQVSLEETLLFFDGSKNEHLNWAREQGGESLKWILVKGRPIDLEAEEGRPVYFDQGGMICRKFGITHVPSRVSQAEKRLLIEEIPLRSTSNSPRGKR